MTILEEAVKNIERQQKGLRTDIGKLHRLRNSSMASQMNIEMRMLMRYEEVGRHCRTILKMIRRLNNKKQKREVK